eukprot:Gb_24189 [translate_table: standard]
MAVCQVPSMITIQATQCDVDVALHLSQTSELKHPSPAEYLSRSKASSCLSSTMVKPNEPEDTATSELRISTESRPLEGHELELSISGVLTAEITTAAVSGFDVPGENLQASSGRVVDLKEGSISISELGEVGLVGPLTKKTRCNAYGFNIDGNAPILENERSQFNCLPSIIGHGATVAGTKKSASSSDRDLSWAHTSRPLDGKLLMSWQSRVNNRSPQLLLSQQQMHGSACKVTSSDYRLFSEPQCKDGSDIGRNTVMPTGVAGFESPVVQGRPSYLFKAFAANGESMGFHSNTGTHFRDEMPPISTGMLYGNISESVKIDGTEVFGQNQSPTELERSGYPPSAEIWQHLPKGNFPAGTFQETASMDLHNRIMGTCSFEGKQPPSLRYLPQRSTELVFNPSIGSGLPLVPFFSTIQPNAAITPSPFATQAGSEQLWENLTSSYSGMNVSILPSMKLGDNSVCHSGAEASHYDMLQSLPPSSDSGFQYRERQHASFSNAFTSGKDCSTLISDLNLSLLAHSQALLSTSAALHSFPSSSGNIASTNSRAQATGGMGLKLSEFLHAPPDFSILDTDDPEVLPSITVVMEGRSIGGRICLQKLDGYEKFACSMRDMFKNNILEDSLSAPGGDCNLSTAIPGFVIAYEDAEGDLLLAGDLSWRDFVRVAKRIRVLPAKNNKRKGTS